MNKRVDILWATLGEGGLVLVIAAIAWGTVFRRRTSRSDIKPRTLKRALAAEDRVVTFSASGLGL